MDKNKEKLMKDFCKIFKKELMDLNVPGELIDIAEKISFTKATFNGLFGKENEPMYGYQLKALVKPYANPDIGLVQHPVGTLFEMTDNPDDKTTFKKQMEDFRNSGKKVCEIFLFEQTKRDERLLISKVIKEEEIKLY